MTWNYAITPRIWPSSMTVILMLALLAYVWPRRKSPGAQQFAISILLGIFWAAGSVMEYAAVETAAKIFWVKYQALWQLPATVSITCFILEYIWPKRWLTRRNLALLLAGPLAAVLTILTNDLHHGFWVGFTVDGSVSPVRGPAAWFFILYAYGVTLLNLVALGWLFLHSPQHRWPLAMIMTGQIGLRVLYMLEKLSILRSDLPLDILGVAFVDLMYTTALFGYQLFDPIRLGRRAAVDQMRIGMLVLDSKSQVVHLNTCAEQMLDAPTRQVRGMSISEVLPAYPETLPPGPGEIEISLGANGDARAVRHFTLSVSPLADFRGLEIGRLLLLHDVTEQRRSHAQILEQQRALATLQERDRLARELHDELSQELALINLQAQLVTGLLMAGQTEQAEAQLQTLGKIAREAQVDVRGEISKLSQRITTQEGFSGALRRFAATFQQTYGIHTELDLSDEADSITFVPMVEAQLLRIVQEAFANIRKHAKAKQVRVAVGRGPGCVTLQIEDDGIGFDPASLLGASQTFGLGIMAERAREVGGRADVKSAPGEGTLVTVVIPTPSEP